MALTNYDVLWTTILSWVRGSWDTRSWVRGSWVPIVFRFGPFVPIFAPLSFVVGGSEQGFDPFFFVLGASAHVWVSVPRRGQTPLKTLSPDP